MVGVAIENLGIFYEHLIYFTAIGNIFGHLVYFMVIWYIFSPVLVCCTEKNLATLTQTAKTFRFRKERDKKVLEITVTFRNVRGRNEIKMASFCFIIN
jgi:ATP-dependent Zn protease